MNQDAHEYEVLSELAAERGFVVQESEVELGNGLTRPCWLVYDLCQGVCPGKAELDNDYRGNGVHPGRFRAIRWIGRAW